MVFFLTTTFPFFTIEEGVLVLPPSGTTGTTGTFIYDIPKYNNIFKNPFVQNSNVYTLGKTFNVIHISSKKTT
jgi:hypothetical protein